DGRDAEIAEQFGAKPQHRLAIFEHVGDARRRAGIVLEHIELVGSDADQIDPANMRPHPVRRADAGDLGAELLVAVDQLGRDQPFLEDPALAVDILEERIDRLDALDQPLAEPGPFLLEENARDDIERNDALSGVAVTIDRKGDAELTEGGFGGLLAALEL